MMHTILIRPRIVCPPSKHSDIPILDTQIQFVKKKLKKKMKRKISLASARRGRMKSAEKAKHKSG